MQLYNEKHNFYCNSQAYKNRLIQGCRIFRIEVDLKGGREKLRVLNRRPPTELCIHYIGKLIQYIS